jgi:serine/threonine protein kinase
LTTDHQRRVRELFDAALDQPTEVRQKFLAGACNGDQHLLDTVGRLLAANDRAAGVLDTPVWQRPAVTSSPGEPGSFIGPYKILHELGGGGMGIVYQAVRADEVFQRICAVKVIRPEISSGWLLERFRQERQILARLDHINIARIVDGGSTSEGLPYFVMDFVDGPSINKFCAEHGLSIRPRLALFQQVCAAVYYLHQNSVIHGDLKPPNILVGNDGSVKLVDFGIASALAGSESQEQNKTLPLMTPGYASPEQMRGKPLTPASDVYSLGVILYELLTGSQPFPASGRSRSELLNVITSQDPVPPSTVAGKHDSSHSIKGELDSIILRAMAREPEGRYSSVAELNADIDRYLQGRPVAAQKSGLLYKGRKYIGRNQRSALATFVIAVLLVAVSWEGMEVRKGYRRAQQDEQVIRDMQQHHEQELREIKIKLANLKPLAGGNEPVPPLAAQLRETQIRDIHEMAEAYRTSFSEAVRLWPGMTRSRRDLLDQADSYLRQAEPYVREDPKAPEQLAGAWLWLANIQGNPQTVNLRDHAGATASISEAQRLLEKSPGMSAQLVEQVKAAARQIEAGR